MTNPEIHPSVILHPSAELGHGVHIGPYVSIGENTRIGAGAQIEAHAVIKANVTIGSQCKIAPGAIIGGDPQHTHCTQEPSVTEIGDNVVIREYVTINRGNGPGQKTIIGDNCILMAYSHVGHDCVLGKRVILANLVQLGGYTQLDDDAFLGGRVVVHQFVQIGRMTMIGAGSTVLQDIPPFAIAANSPAEVYSINTVGLKRHGFSLDLRTELKKAYSILLSEKQNLSQGLEQIANELESSPELTELVDFIMTSKRGIRFRASGRKERNHVSSVFQNAEAEGIPTVQSPPQRFPGRYISRTRLIH